MYLYCTLPMPPQSGERSAYDSLSGDGLLHKPPPTSHLPHRPPLSLGSLPSFLPQLSPSPTSSLSSYFILSNPFHGASCVNNRDQPSVFSLSERKMPEKPGHKELAARRPRRWSMALCLSRPPLSASGTFWAECWFSVHVWGWVLSVQAGVFMRVWELSVTIAPCKYWPNWIATVSSRKSKHRVSRSARYAPSFVTNCTTTGNNLACWRRHLRKSTPLLSWLVRLKFWCLT